MDIDQMASNRVRRFMNDHKFGNQNFDTMTKMFVLWDTSTKRDIEIIKCGLLFRKKSIIKRIHQPSNSMCPVFEKSSLI